MERLKVFFKVFRLLQQKQRYVLILQILFIITFVKSLFQYTEFRIHRENVEQSIFIYQSYIYENITTLNNLHIEENLLLVLFIADKDIKFQNFICAFREGENYRTRLVHAEVEHIGALGMCHLEVFVTRCYLRNHHKRNGTEQRHIVIGFGQSLFNPTFGKYKTANLSPLYPNKPNLQQQQLVICINRIFAFEKWQLFITVMEVYRLLKVDLVSLHVISAISSIFELMKAYEAEGRLVIRPGVIFPYLPGMKYNPNTQTEFNGQVLLGHECFYEYRESAEFIAILDLDDLLITTQFPTLSESFIQARADYPTAAYFTPNKMESSFIEQDQNPRKFNILELIHRGILTAHMYADEKMVMRPKLVRGFWMHNSIYLEAGKIVFN